MSRSWLLTTGLILVTASYGTCDEVEATNESTTGQIQVAVEQFRESLGELESRVRRIGGDEEQRDRSTQAAKC